MDGHQAQQGVRAAPGGSDATAAVGRRPLIQGLVAAGVLCLGWLVPYAHAENDPDGGAGAVPADSQPSGAKTPPSDRS